MDNGYVFFFENRRIEVYAASLYEAKQKALLELKPPKSKAHRVHGMLAESNGEPVTHTADF